MMLRSLRLVFTVAVSILLLAGQAQAKNWTYNLYLKGIVVHHLGKKIPLQKREDMFIVTWIGKGSKRTEAILKTPGDNDYWTVKRGQVYPLKNLVWTGGEYDIVFHAQVWKMNHFKRNLLTAMVTAGGILLAAGITVGSGGFGAAVAGGVVGASSAWVGTKIQEDFSRFAMFLGQDGKTIQMSRVGTLADGASQSYKKKINYDFTTRHRANRGDYTLYWEVTRY